MRQRALFILVAFAALAPTLAYAAGVTSTSRLAGSIAGTVTRASDGTPVSGATVQAVLTGIVVQTATSGADGSFTLPAAPGTYDVRAAATGFCNEVRSGVIVSDTTTTTINVAMYQPGTAAGKVTQADGTTAIPGAAVTFFSGSTTSGRTNTDVNGNYTVSGLHPGSLTMQVVAVGYQTQELAVSITESTTTTANASLNLAPPGSVTYVYDDLNRLVSVVDAGGQAATYGYDAVGNLLSITRAAAGSVSIGGTSPGSGSVGTTVTIYGTGFSATAGQNAVAFNGVAAIVTSATSSQIVTSVPTGATTGPVTVSAPAGNATSATPFTVTPPPLGIPTISGFAPTIGTAMTAVTITGTNFDPAPANDRVSFNGAASAVTSVTSTSIPTAVPAAAASGRITVTTPSGTAVSAADFFVPPPGYTASNVLVADRMTVGGSYTATFGSAGKIGLILFDAIPGHRISVQMSQVTIAFTAVTVYGPTRLSLASGTTTTLGNFIDPFVAAWSGTYMVLIVPGSSYTGSITLTVYDVPPDVTGPITAGGSPVPVSLTVPGQNAALSFTATAGQRVSVLLTNFAIGSGACPAALKLKDANGTVISQNNCVGPTYPGWLDVTAPLAAGTYTVLVDPQYASTGTTSVNVYNVVDVSGPIVAGGAAVPVSLPTPGQKATLNFSASPGQQVSVNFTSISFTGPASNACALSLVVRDSAGNVVTANTCTIYGSIFLDSTTLVAGGNYSIVIDPNGAKTGTVMVALYAFADVTGSLTIGGASAFVNIATPGQNAYFTFAGTAGQPVTVYATNNSTNAYVTVTVYRQDGTTSIASTTDYRPTFTISIASLPANETYTIRIDRSGASTGSMYISVTSP